MANRLHKTTRLAEILNQDSLAAYKQTAHDLARLNEILGLYLDTQLSRVVNVASWKEGTLTLATSNSTAAGQLRYLSRIHLQRLRQHDEFCGLLRIKVVSAPPNPTSREKPANPLQRLSPETGKLLKELAESLGQGEVSEAIRRLARHALTNGASNCPTPEKQATN
ncbi:MAG: DUF721 domain-containing protein [Moraxellaceae bacterium]|nr:DUF721 domain-containing protein [Moraxellaceae bacterium]